MHKATVRGHLACFFTQVCPSAEDYDRELGLCVCGQPSGARPCDGPCRRSPTTQVKLQCRTSGEAELVYDNHVRRGQKGFVFNHLVIFIFVHLVCPFSHLAVINRSAMSH